VIATACLLQDWTAAILTEKSERSKNHLMRFHERAALATQLDGATHVPLAGGN
jgi:hypothetical protein